jgi:hypothetical protein
VNSLARVVSNWRRHSIGFGRFGAANNSRLAGERGLVFSCQPNEIEN